MNNWISVKDKLPESKEPVLCYQVNNYHPEHNQVICSYYEGKFREVEYAFAVYDEEREHYEGEYSFVTHWMPLPKQPNII